MIRVSSIFSQLLHGSPAASSRRWSTSTERSGGLRVSPVGPVRGHAVLPTGQAHSLREIHDGLQASEGRLRHLGLTGAPPRTTSACANQHGPHSLFGEFFEVAFQRPQARWQAVGIFGKETLDHPLSSLDATAIDLCAAMFDWAKFRTTKGAVKLHLLLDHEGHLPAYAVITPGKQHEIRVSRT